MKIKGTAFLGRKVFIIKTFGQDTWDRLIEEFSEKVPSFRREILPITHIESRDFLRFNDFIVDKLYEGRRKIYWTFGNESAKWALEEGPLKAFVQSRKLDMFVGTISHMWKAYYTEGEAYVKNIDKHVYEVGISGVEYKHVYYEYTTFGFLETGLFMAGASHVNLNCLRGFSKGDDDILYRVSLKL